MCCIPTTGLAAEIAPFRLTGIEGRVELRYLFDERASGRLGEESSRESNSGFEQEVFLLTHSYIYHPNFLKMDLGAGPVFAQHTFKSELGDKTSRDTLYNVTARLMFLDKKPYPLTLYYDHVSSAVYPGLLESLLQTNTRYGFNVSLLQPVTPVSLNLEAYRLHSEGEGLTRIVDDTTDYAAFRAYRSLGQDAYGQFSYHWNRRQSASGNPNLPIQASTSTTNTATFDSWVAFGERRQYRLSNLVSYVTADNPRNRQLRFSPYLSWQHSDTLRSFYRYSLLKSSYEDLHTTDQSASMGVAHELNKNVSISANLHGEDSRTTGLDVQSYGGRGTISYRRPLSFGTLHLNAGLGHKRYDRKAAAAAVQVFGEGITLAGTTPVALANDFVIAPSIQVSNLARTQTFTEGLDYRVTVIGATTWIERLAGGAIGDPEDVLVDYQYQTGGTFAYTDFQQSYGANLELFRYYKLYVDYRDSAQTLVSGDPTVPLRSGQNIAYGGRADYPFWQAWRVGGEARFENQRENIASFERRSYDAYLQFPLPRFSTLRVSAGRVLVDNIGSVENVDLTREGVMFRSRPWRRVVVTAEAAHEEDTGGTVYRSRSSGSLGAEWRIRELAVRAEGRYVKERQGDAENKRVLIRATVRREF